MKNHFIIAYNGNKRDEAEEIYKHVDFSKIETIIEPFCGTSAMSYFISTKHPKKFKYILNDNNIFLVTLYKILKDELEIDKFNESVEKFIKKFNTFTEDEPRKKFYLEQLQILDGVLGYFLRNKYYNIRPGLYPNIKSNKQLKPFNMRDYPIYQFMKNENVIVSNRDGVELIKDHMSDQKCIIMLDPPYLNSENHFYENPSTDVYEFLLNNNINNMKAKIVLVLENNWIIKLLFKTNNILCEYGKTYQARKKKTTHLIIGQKH